MKVVLTTADPDGPEIKAFRKMVGLAASFAGVRFFVFVRAKVEDILGFGGVMLAVIPGGKSH